VNKKIKLGDRVWVKKPSRVTERRVGTVISTNRTGDGLRYLVEWDIDTKEPPNHHRGYLETEIAAKN
jgi:hypothetical protein